MAKIFALLLGGPGPVVSVSVNALCGNGFFRLVMGLQSSVLSRSSTHLRLSSFAACLTVLLSSATSARSPCWRCCPPSLQEIQCSLCDPWLFRLKGLFWHVGVDGLGIQCTWGAPSSGRVLVRYLRFEHCSDCVVHSIYLGCRCLLEVLGLAPSLTCKHKTRGKWSESKFALG